MSKFNKNETVTAARPSGPIASTDEVTRTGEGGRAHRRGVKDELFLLAVSNMVGEQTFYEGSTERDLRFRSLIEQVAVFDPDWLTRFARWLRADANMRSASLVVAAEGVHARLASGLSGGNRTLIESVLQRADEPGEMLAYWTSRFGRAVPMPVKRGIADAVERLYTQRSVIKYDTASKGYRFGDVLDLTHPDASSAEQAALYEYILARRHNREGIVLGEPLWLLRNRERLFAMPQEERREVVVAAALASTSITAGQQMLREAGMTWETLATWLDGPMDRAAWEAIIPSMGYMALLRNLRNFDQANVSDTVADRVIKTLVDPEQVANSRQLPMRFLSAYRAAPSLRWGHALETALNLSMGNVPSLRGSTLILWDCSGSMNDRLSARSDLTRRDAAGVFAGALAMRAERATLVQFGQGSKEIRLTRAGSVLRLIDHAPDMGGTATSRAVQRHYSGHDRVVIVTDEQYNGGYFSYDGGDPGKVLSESVPLYTWNLAGYRSGGQTGTRNRWTFGGLSDQGFGMIPLIEAGRTGQWPF